MVIIFGKASSPVKRWICRALYPDLATKAAERLKAQGDGTLGRPPGAPFNAIVLTAGGRFVPEPLKHQLVIPIGPERGPRRLLPITRTGAQSWQEEELLQVYFVPLRGAYGFALT